MITVSGSVWRQWRSRRKRQQRLRKRQELISLLLSSIRIYEQHDMRWFPPEDIYYKIAEYRSRECRRLLNGLRGHNKKAPKVGPYR